MTVSFSKGTAVMIKITREHPNAETEMHGARIVWTPSLCIAVTLSSISDCRPAQLARDVSMSMTDTTLMETEGQHDAGI
jgi:hypothetical protein